MAYFKKNFIILAASISLVLHIGCSCEDNMNNKSAQLKRGSSITIPSKKSKLNGWNGIKIVKCGPKCCELQFPDDFGFNNVEQLMILRGLVNQSFEHDVDCMLLVNVDALDQIKIIATKKQDADAARMLLLPKKFGGFALDGEVASEYPGAYQLTVMEKFTDLPSILDEGDQAAVSTAVCSWLEVLGEKQDVERVKKLIVRLKSIKMELLAHNLSVKCSAMLQ